MNRTDEPVDLRLLEKLASLTQIPERNPQIAARRRADFLSAAKLLPAPVTGEQNQRHTKWIDPILTFFHKKERSPMFAPLISLVVAVSLLAGGGVTVYGAQGSLPGDTLYPVKLASEEARLELARTPLQESNLQLQFIRRRVNEIEALLQQGETLPTPLLARLQAQLDQSLDLAAGMDDNQLKQLLERTIQQLRDHLRSLEQASQEPGVTLAGDPALAQARDLVRDHLHWAEAGLIDPQAFRSQWHNHHKQGILNPTGQGTGLADTQALGGGPEPKTQVTNTCTPGSNTGAGSPDDGTPDPGSGYGPDHDSRATATPAGLSQDNHDADTPDPGDHAGSGPGSQPCSTCTPQSGFGPPPETESGGHHHDDGGDEHGDGESGYDSGSHDSSCSGDGGSGDNGKL